MQPFRFRLDRILEWQQEQYRVEEDRTRSCHQAVTRVQELISKLKAERLAIERDLLESRVTTGSALSALGFYRLRITCEETRRQGELGEAEASLKEQRARLAAAKQKLRVLENLRSRRLSEHQYASQRELENLAGDAYLARWTPA